ncbi:MAG: hypothetical protein IKW21_02895 [Lachnospiraceae bacterium]|nr:hypothetical protein [Lachnospiraceae bacterium]
MIISVDELKKYISVTEPDAVLEGRLQALEVLIREKTNNNFQKRNIRTKCPIMTRKLYTEYEHFKVGDTVQISQSFFNDGVYTVVAKDGRFIELNEELIDESEVIATLVVYPADLKMGVIDILNWKIKNADKAGLSSETISRHSQTFDRATMNNDFGVPNELVGFLKHYQCARR